MTVSLGPDSLPDGVEILRPVDGRQASVLTREALAFVADVADPLAGAHGVIGLLLALRARESTGRGQHVDIAMSDASLPLLMVSMARY